jgi:mitochondrial inner membrane protease subunit 2
MAFGAAWSRAKANPLIRDTARYLFICATWYPVFFFVEKHVVGTTRVRGPSMYPYLNETYNETRFGDICLTWKLYAQQDLKRGMIVTF